MSSVDLERPVIRVNAVAAGSGWRGCSAAVAVPASDVRKSAEFYRRVFGFRIPSTWRGASFGPSYAATVLVAGDGRTELWLQARGDRPAQARRWAFAVSNLEEVREAVWELGVKVARDSGDPDQIFRRRSSASLYVLDPDGNEIELVETSSITSRDRPRRGRAAFFGPWCGQNSKPAPITQVESFSFTPGGGSRS